jgi:hypothetical protein
MFVRNAAESPFSVVSGQRENLFRLGTPSGRACNAYRCLEFTKQRVGMPAQLVRFFPSIHTRRVHASVDGIHESGRNLVFGRARLHVGNAPLLVKILMSGADWHLTILPSVGVSRTSNRARN